MRHKKFGGTGLFVSELCLGTMTFGGGGRHLGQIGDLQQADAERLVGRRSTPASTSSTPPTSTRRACPSRSPARR